MRHSVQYRVITSFALFVFCLSIDSGAYGQDLVAVDGVSTKCETGQSQGAITLYPGPTVGICNGSVKHDCNTNIWVPTGGPFSPQGHFTTASSVCVGNFTSWHDVEAKQEARITALEQKAQQFDVLSSNIKLLSDTIDALSKRMDDLENKLNKLLQNKQ